MQMCKRNSKCALVRFQFSLCCCNFQLLCDPFLFSQSMTDIAFFFSRSFSQKRAAVEKDYALVRQSQLLLVCHGAALMFVETSFLNSSRPSAPLLPPPRPVTQRKNKTQLRNRQSNVFRRCVKFVFSLSPHRSFRNRPV